MSKHHRPDQKPVAHQIASTPPPGAWWNNISKVWIIEGDGGPVACDPQPAPPPMPSRVPGLTEAYDPAAHTPPAVKVFL